MMVNVKLAGGSGGEDNVKSWIAKLPSDGDVSSLNLNFHNHDCRPCGF